MNSDPIFRVEALIKNCGQGDSEVLVLKGIDLSGTVRAMGQVLAIRRTRQLLAELGAPQVSSEAT